VALAFYFIIRLKIRFRTMMTVLALGLLAAWINLDQLLYKLERNKKGSDDDFETHIKSVSNISTDPSNLERLNRWHSAVLMFKERPILGFGPGTYTFQYGSFQRPEDLTIISTFSGDLGNTHSEYFNSLSETGLVGFLSWVGIMLATLATALKVIYRSRQARIKYLGVAALLGLITYWVHGFVNNYSDFDKIAAPMWGFIAVVVALDIYFRKETRRIP
jgi:O-antigen ligase